MSHTTKIHKSSPPKKRTLKQTRCPRGEYRNPVTNICEPIVKPVKKTIMGCSSTYEPQDDAEKNRE